MKNYNKNRKAQLAVILILLLAIGGVLFINTTRVSAERQIQSPSAADVQIPAETDSNAFVSTAMPSMIKVISALIIVIIAIYGGIYLLKKSMGRKYSGNRGKNLMEVIETTYVAPKKMVTLLRVDDKAVLIGTTENGMTVLTELDKARTSAIMATMASETSENEFKNIFNQAAKRIKDLSLKRSGRTLLENQ